MLKLPWPSKVTASLYMHNCIPVGYYNDSLVYNSINANGFWDVYINGSAILPAVPHHRGATDIKDSRLLITEARYNAIDSAPGQGAANDLHLVDLSTSTIVNLVPGTMGLFWARWHPNKDRIVWSQQTSATPLPFGTQEVMVADVVNEALANQISYNFGGFNETYGWLDDDTLMLCSDKGQNWLGTNLYTLEDAPGATLKALGTQGTYHEFAFVPPSGMFDTDSLIFGWCNASIGIELWKKDLTTNKDTRLTYFMAGPGAGANQLCFVPDNPNQLLVSVITGKVMTQLEEYDTYILTMP